VAAALAGKPAVLGVISAGQFPREMALEPDGQRLLVTNYLSGQLEAVSIPTIPLWKLDAGGEREGCG
jgi:DNA-binding beta-propeller fold protein YncE